MKTGSIIREIRTKKGLTQKDLADSIGTRENYISDIETGKREPGRKLVDQIATRFGISSTFLMFLSLEDNEIKEEEKELYCTVKNLIDRYVNDCLLEK